MSQTIRRKVIENFIGLQSISPATSGPHAITQIHGFSIPATERSGSYSVIQVDTRSGITGYGECKPLTRADMQHLNRLVGRSAYSYEALTPLAPEAAQGGLNMALLDIVGKITKSPVYRVLGGPTRFKARAIARLAGTTNDEMKADMQRHFANGVRAFLVPVDAPPARNQGAHFVRIHLERMRYLKAASPDADFAVEGRDELSPGDAGSLAAALQSMRPLWFDEPCSVTNLETIRKVSEETVVPLAFGRTIQNASTFQDLLREGLIDLVRPDLLLYGISGVCRIAAMAETYYTAVAPWHDAGPLATAAALHAAASMPNFFILQLPHSGAVYGTIRDGFFELPQGPGLGVTVDKKDWERNRIA